MDLAPVGRSGLQCSQTKPLQQDPDTLTQKGEQQKERNAGEGETSNSLADRWTANGTKGMSEERETRERCSLNRPALP
ncbi:hypothetical protein INR49_000579 [Caranx melampygus]|nr:hypothetical protein INR49_000579 [Caranx melampygus]